MCLCNVFLRFYGASWCCRSSISLVQGGGGGGKVNCNTHTHMYNVYIYIYTYIYIYNRYIYMYMYMYLDTLLICSRVHWHCMCIHLNRRTTYKWLVLFLPSCTGAKGVSLTSKQDSCLQTRYPAVQKQNDCGRISGSERFWVGFKTSGT